MAPQSPNEALQPEALPPPPPRAPPRRRPLLSTLSGFMSFLVVVAVAALAGLAWGSNRLHEPGPLPAARTVYIVPHTDVPDIIDKLADEGVIDSPLAMKVVLTAERKRTKIKAGEYLFKEHASLRDVIDTLVSGKQFLHPFTIPEGLTSQQIVQRIRESELLSGDVREVPKEGALLPETYKVSRGASRGELVLKMQDDNRRMVEQIWAKRAPDLPLRSPFDMLTLASIVEKETGKAEERPHVAGVFVNRLRKHMRLQSDPTIVYGLVGGQGTLGHPITRSELDKRTTYNTYQIDGLPPGPIDNPGRAALEAVANPMRTSDLFFVADGTGGHAFSESLDDHNRNVGHLRQLEKDTKVKGEADKLAPGAIVPAAASPTRQRSEVDPSVFGALPTRFAASAGPTAAFADREANHDIDRVFAAVDARAMHAHAFGTSVLPTVENRGLDAMGFDGRTATGASLLDGPTAPSPGKPAAPAQPPAPAASTKLAALDGADHPDLFSEPAGDAAPIAPAKAPPLHPKVFDVSQNTALDPLRNKSFDLNTGKSVPAEMLR